MDDKTCKKAGGRCDTKNKVCDFGLKGVIANKWWIVQKVGDDIFIFNRNRYDVADPLKGYIGSLQDEEPGWQPKSIQINQDTLVRMEESNTAIFFPRNKIRKQRWKNTDIRRAR